MTLPEWYREACAASASIADRQVFFVMGCQKSGTTWVSGLLDAHPEVCCGGEGHVSDMIGPMVEQVARLYNEDERTSLVIGSDGVLAAVRLLADQILAQCLEGRADPETVRWLGDRTPEAAKGVQALAAVYPGAKFIHVIRDGRDAAVSGWAHLKRQGKDAQFRSFAEYAAYFASGHWVPYIQRARRAAEQCAPDRYCEVRYEALHGGPEAETSRLLSFLGADAGPEPIATCVAAASFATVTGGRAPGQEDPGSHFRKGVVGDWRHAFDDEALRQFLAEGEALLDELGYLDDQGDRRLVGVGSREGRATPSRR